MQNALQGLYFSLSLRIHRYKIMKGGTGLQGWIQNFKGDGPKENAVIGMDFCVYATLSPPRKLKRDMTRVDV